MSSAIAEVFVRAYQSLSEAQREEVVSALLAEKEVREQLHDLAVLDARREEPVRPLREVLAELPDGPA